MDRTTTPRREATSERITAEFLNSAQPIPRLSVDIPLELGEPIPIAELTEGLFVLAVGPTDVASGAISSMARKDGKLSLVLQANSRRSESYMPPLAVIDDVSAVYRIAPYEAVKEPSWFARIFMWAKPSTYAVAPTISEIFGQELPSERIGLEDEGKIIILPWEDDIHWSIHRITSVEEPGLSFKATFDTNYSSTSSQNLRALIFR